MFPRSTTASINSSLSRHSSSLLAVTLDAPKPVLRGFRPCPARIPRQSGGRARRHGQRACFSGCRI